MDIFAGNISFKMKEKDLEELFSKFGAVTAATIIIDKHTRQNKGFGFVEMPNNKEALKAIRALNGKDLDGRKLVVSEAEKNSEGEKTNAGPKDWFKKSKYTNKEIISWGENNK